LSRHPVACTTDSVPARIPVIPRSAADVRPGAADHLRRGDIGAGDSQSNAIQTHSATVPSLGEVVLLTAQRFPGAIDKVFREISGDSVATLALGVDHGGLIWWGHFPLPLPLAAWVNP